MAHFFRITALGLVIAAVFLMALQDSRAQVVRPPPVITIYYEYDALGRLVHVNNPLAGNREYLYDGAGNRLFVATNGEAKNLASDAQDDSNDTGADGNAPTNPRFIGINGCNFPTGVDIDGRFSFTWKGAAGVFLVRRTVRGSPGKNPTREFWVNGNIYSENGLPDGWYQYTVLACNEEDIESCSNPAPMPPGMTIRVLHQCNSRNQGEEGS